MDAEDLASYWIAMRQIDAEEMLIAIKVESYPNLKNEARDKLINHLMRTAYPDTFKERAIDITDFGRILHGG